MKKYFAIALLILLNAFSIALFYFATIFMFTFFFLPLPESEALELADTYTWRLVIMVFVISISTLILNYLIFKRMIAIKRPKLFSALLSSIGIIVFIPVLIKSREVFIAYHKSMGELKGDVKGILDWLF
jgi:hypothetical protein